MAKALLFSIALSLILISCNVPRPTAPDDVADNTIIPDPPPSVLPYWKPCVVVHTPGFKGTPEFENQFAAIRKLKSAGRMTWIRFGSDNTDYYNEARLLNLNIFTIIDTDQLEKETSWEKAFDLAYSQYPNNTWEVAGEISNPAVHSILLTPGVYMEKFKRLYRHVRQRYPNVSLVSAPTFGSASTRRNRQGPVEFERFIELGLLDMDVIVAVNVYTENALLQYSDIFDRYAFWMRNKRVWVTETGIDDPARHIDWVERFYLRIINTLRPEMICWYALWGGDGPPGVGDAGFGLLSNVGRPPVIENPLFKRLIGSGR